MCFEDNIVFLRILIIIIIITKKSKTDDLKIRKTRDQIGGDLVLIFVVLLLFGEVVSSSSKGPS